jgi:hypothetical protein
LPVEGDVAVGGVGGRGCVVVGGATWTRELVLPTASVVYTTLAPVSIAGGGNGWLGTHAAAQSPPYASWSCRRAGEFPVQARLPVGRLRRGASAQFVRIFTGPTGKASTTRISVLG